MHQQFLVLIKHSPEYTEIFKQVRACNTRGMVGVFGNTTLRTYVLAGRLMLTFHRGGRQVTLLTAADDKTRLGLHSCDITEEDLQGVAVDVLGCDVDLQPDESARLAY